MGVSELARPVLSGKSAVNLINAKNAVNIHTITALNASANHFAL
jgi:hypothetical protein